MKNKMIAGVIGAALIGSWMMVYASGELVVTEGFVYSKNGQTQAQPTATPRYNITGDGKVANIQLVSTNILGDALVLGGVNTLGWATFQNSGPTFTYTNTPQVNAIEIGSLDSAGVFWSFARLDTNQTGKIWLSTNAPRARATGTNSVRLNFTIIDR